MNETPATVLAPSFGKTYAIVVENKAGVEAYLLKIARRFEKKGLTGFSWTWGKAFERIERDRSDIITSRTLCVELTLNTHRPNYAGWNFVATIMHMKQVDGSNTYENILHTVPGCMVHDDCKLVGPEMGLACVGVTDIPNEFRNRGPVCDHCKIARRRSDTYVLHHTDGRYAQVGSTCIADFLGSKDAEHIAFRAEMYAIVAKACKDAEKKPETTTSTPYEPTSTWGTLLSVFLGYTVWAIRTQGWVSKAASKDGKGRATASLAAEFTWNDQLRDLMNYEVTDSDLNLAQAAAEWAENLTDEDVNGKDEYLANLRAIARTGLVSWRTQGQAASIIVSYGKAMGVSIPGIVAPKPRPAKGTLYVGEVGMRVAFGTTKKLPKTTTKLSAEPVTFMFASTYVNAYEETKTTVKFRTAEGAVLTWFASGVVLSEAKEGDTFMLVGTIKAHNEYKDEKQTILSRCDVTSTRPAPEVNLTTTVSRA